MEQLVQTILINDEEMVSHQFVVVIIFDRTTQGPAL